MIYNVSTTIRKTLKTETQPSRHSWRRCYSEATILVLTTDPCITGSPAGKIDFLELGTVNLIPHIRQIFFNIYITQKIIITLSKITQVLWYYILGMY